MIPHRNDRGVVGGGEALAFGTLILLAGALLVVNLWSILDTRTAVDAAAREYLRSYTRSETHDGGVDAGRAAAAAVLDGRGTPLHGLRFDDPAPRHFGPCGTATLTLSVVVPAARVPFLGTLAQTEVAVTVHELIDAHREVIADARFDPDATACAAP